MPLAATGATPSLRPATVTCATPRGAALDDFELLSVIGKGTFGRVFLARHRHSERLVALKMLSKARCAEEKRRRWARTERAVLGRARHPFVCTLEHAFQNERALFFAIEFCAGGELFFHLSRMKRFAEGVARFYAAELCLALEHLHSLHIAYRDLKPENVLLSGDGHVRLVDFGLAKEGVREPDRGASSMCGTYEYLAPEVIRRCGHGWAVDWWAFGMVLHEMLTGLPPFYTKDHKVLFERILHAPLQLPATLSPSAASFVEALLERKVQARLGSSRDAAEIKAHGFFAAAPWDMLAAQRTPPPFAPCRDGGAGTLNFDRRFTGLNV